MKKEKIIEYAKSLANITIKKHKEKLLGKEKMSKFIKENLIDEVKNSDYDAILHLYNRYLAREGYEIKKDTNNFDIVDYNSEEYKNY